MRAREFTINVPITVKINGDGDPEIDMPGHDSADSEDAEDLDQNPVYVSPLQQELELKKAENGKESPVIDKITQDDDLGDEDDEDEEPLNNRSVF
jgi:hypothetical protein